MLPHPIEGSSSSTSPATSPSEGDLIPSDPFDFFYILNLSLDRFLEVVSSGSPAPD
jgi:hypothetical protein